MFEKLNTLINILCVFSCHDLRNDRTIRMYLSNCQRQGSIYATNFSLQ